MWKRLLTCLAFAAWCFANVWVELGQGRGAAYLTRYDPRRAVALPVVCCSVVIALLLVAAWEFCRRRRCGKLAHLLFLASCLLPAGVAAVALVRLSPVDLSPVVRHRLFWPAAFVVLLAPVVFAVMRPCRASRIMRGLLLYSWPVLAIILVQAVRLGLGYSAAEFRDGRRAPRFGTVPRTRVVWIVFDGLSQKVLFDSRPDGLRAPNFDKLRAECFYASAAEPPQDMTELCMPALIDGELFASAEPKGPSTLHLTSRERTGPLVWGTRENVFDTARAMRLNTALVGWYHPYGRVLNQRLTVCFWTAGWLNPGAEQATNELPLLSLIGFRLHQQFVIFPLVGHLPGVRVSEYQRREAITSLEYLLAHARELAVDPSVGLVLLHLPVPHPPPVYSRRQNAITPDGDHSYADSLALTDRILGDLRRQLEQNGLWDRTAVIVSADHGWRPALWRGGPDWNAEDARLPQEGTLGVPFLVKLPGRQPPAVYTKPFNTVVTRAVITGILKEQIANADELEGVLARGAPPR